MLLEETPYYHCVSRCVRRAFLCGVDSHIGENYEHRHPWIVDRMKQLADIFAIDICSYAVLHNHYHVILHIDSQLAAEWDDHEVIERWGRLFSIPEVVQRYLCKETITQAERDSVSELLTKWRSRLHDISWFMRCLNEPIARMANKDDGCTGRFWEGRYKSQALLDEKALAAYVDLNPLRAGLAETPGQSECTSIKERTHLFKKSSDSNKETDTPRGLLPFVGYPRKDMPKGVPFRLVDYLELVDWMGRAILDNKRGYIPDHKPPVLDRLQIDSKHWLYRAEVMLRLRIYKHTLKTALQSKTLSFFIFIDHIEPIFKTCRYYHLESGGPKSNQFRIGVFLVLFLVFLFSIFSSIPVASYSP